MEKITTLSVTIIVKNEAQHVQRCLESVTWADEIIILDSGSTDNTVEICKQYTDKVFETDWPGFGIQKNRALEKVSSDWVLSIDADEWLSDDLIKEIQQTIASPSGNVFSIPRRTQYFGEWIYHGDVGKDRVARLFKKDTAKFTNDIVHESLDTGSHQVGQLQYFLYHDSYNSVEALMDRMNQYTTLSAKIRYEKGKSSSLFKAITHGLWAFIKSYILRAGFLDGRIGFIVAVSSAESSYYRYLKLLYLNRVEKK
jgi:glycosyltransferase involved in cell wall biosynthesis